MKKLLKIALLTATIGIFAGCADKPAKIDYKSPCACYDIIKVG